MPRCLAVALLLAACSHGTAQTPAPTAERRQPAMEPCGTEVCAQNEVCFYNARRAGAFDNPQCKLAPAACSLNVTCECLIDHVLMSVCDDTGGITKVTLY